MANDENKIILEFPATNVEIEFGETITFDNISGFLDSGRVTYNGESLTEEIAHLENDKADNTKIAPEYDEEKTYYRGDIVLYNGVLYECDITDTSGEFYPSDWKEITLGEGIEEVKNLLDSDYYTKIQSDYRFLGKTNPSGTGYFSLNRRGSAGAYSVSVGRLNEANAQSSFAEGESNTSSGYASHSEGYGNAASGLMAHAEGVTTESRGYGSHSEGVGTIANHIGQHVFGAYNVADPSTAQPTAKGNYIEIVGNGTDDDRRRNARTLDWQGNEMLMGDLTFNGNKSLTSEISRLDGRITELPEAMVFKGTLGVNGDIQTLPTASAEIEGWTFKCITAGTYAGLTLKVGDSVTCFNPPNTSVYEWDISGYGDTDTDTWRAIKVNGTEELGSGISSGSVDFVGSENIDVEFDSNGNKIGVKTKNIYTKEEVDDIVYNILPDDTASGSVANFETDLALPIKSLKIDVNAKQDLHGYDYPWTAGGGKNVYPLIAPDTKNGITLTNDNGVITLNGTATADAYFDIDNLNILLPSGSKLYICAFNPVAAETRLSLFLITNNIGNPQVNMNNANAILDTTISADAIGTRLRLRVPNGATYSNFKLSPYLQIGGDTPTSFTPYSNICPIEGWSDVQIANCGNTELTPFLRGLLQGKYGFVEMNSLNWMSSTYADVNYFVTTLSLPNVKAPAASGQTANAICNGYKNVPSNGVTSPVFVSGTMFIWTTGRLFVKDSNYTDVSSFVSSLQGKYLIYELATSVIPTITEEQINTICEAFNANNTFVKINLGGTYYGGYLTIDKYGHRQFVATHEYETNMGQYNYAYVSASNCFRTTNFNKAYKRTAYTIIANSLCSHYGGAKLQEVLNQSANNSTYAFGIVGLYNGSVLFRNTSYSNATAFKSSMQGVTMTFELETPIIIDLPDGEPINTLVGTNNIFADTGDTSVVFKDSVNGYVEKKIASVQALVLNT